MFSHRLQLPRGEIAPPIHVYVPIYICSLAHTICALVSTLVVTKDGLTCLVVFSALRPLAIGWHVFRRGHLAPSCKRIPWSQPPSPPRFAFTAIHIRRALSPVCTARPGCANTRVHARCLAPFATLAAQTHACPHAQAVEFGMRLSMIQGALCANQQAADAYADVRAVKALAYAARPNAVASYALFSCICKAKIYVVVQRSLPGNCQPAAGAPTFKIN
eukprot:5480351-Pleurochrysis_carterae.AAC.1